MHLYCPNIMAALEDIDWDTILPSKIEEIGSSREPAAVSKKVSIVVSLLLFLNVPFAPLLAHLFESDDVRLRTRAGNFLEAQLNEPTTSKRRFAVATLFQTWMTKFPNHTETLRRHVVWPNALKIVLQENN